MKQRLPFAGLAAREWMRRATGVGLVLTLAVTLATMLSGGMPHAPAIIVYCVTIPLMALYLPVKTISFVGLCAVIAAFLVVDGDWMLLDAALFQSAGFAALIVSLVLLRSAAVHSASLARLSESVASLPRGRRDLGLSFAAHFVGLLLNVGLFGLLAPMISRAGVDPREQRHMALVVLRGFGPTMLWAPTAAAQVVITTVVPGVTWWGLVPFTFSMAMALIALGWLYGITAEGRAPVQTGTAAAFDTKSFWPILGLVIVMFAVIITLHAFWGLHLMPTIMIVSLCVFLFWTLAQAPFEQQSLAAVLRSRARECLDRRFSAASSEVMTIAAAGFMAAAIPPLLPEAWIGALMTPLSQHRFLLFPCVSVAIALLSAIGLNPLVAASLIGGTFSLIPPTLLEPYLLAFSLAAGWGVAYGISPFTTGTVVLAGELGSTPGTVAWRWNGPFSLVAMAFVLTVVTLMTWLAPPSLFPIPSVQEEFHD